VDDCALNKTAARGHFDGSASPGINFFMRAFLDEPGTYQLYQTLRCAGDADSRHLQVK
jgi:hypothetical protein